MLEAKPSVLVVEDEEAVRTLIVTILRLSGFDAIPCCDIGEAQDLMAVNGNSIQLMITDVNLGSDQSGIELARALRGTYRRLKVLYISGLVDESQVSREVNAGLAHFLPKPFTTKALTDRVGSIMDDRFHMARGKAAV